MSLQYMSDYLGEKKEPLLKETMRKELKRKGKISSGLEASTLQHIRSGMTQEQRRIAAEDKLVQAALHGKQAALDAFGEEDMSGGDVFIADNITVPSNQPMQPVPPPQIIQAPAPTIEKPDTFKNLLGIAALLAAVGVPSSILMAKMLDRPPTVVEDKDTNTHRGIRFLR